MVLQIGETKVDTEITIDKLYSNFPELEKAGAKFASIPCRSVQGSEGVLYIRYRVQRLIG